MCLEASPPTRPPTRSCRIDTLNMCVHRVDQQIHTHSLTHTHTRAHTRTRTRGHAHAHAQAHAHAHIHTRTYRERVVERERAKLNLFARVTKRLSLLHKPEPSCVVSR